MENPPKTVCHDYYGNGVETIQIHQLVLPFHHHQFKAIQIGPCVLLIDVKHKIN